MMRLLKIVNKMMRQGLFWTFETITHRFKSIGGCSAQFSQMWSGDKLLKEFHIKAL